MNAFIGFIESDYFIEPDMYEVLLKNLKKYDADISMCAYSPDYENGKSVKPVSSQIDVEIFSGDIWIVLQRKAMKQGMSLLNLYK